MSHFYATIPKSERRTVPTAYGHKGTGISTIASSYAGAIRVDLWHSEATGQDMYEVHQQPWQGAGERRLLASGVVGS